MQDATAPDGMYSNDDLSQRPPRALSIAVSHAQDEALALAEIARQIAPTNPGFILLFLPGTLDPQRLAHLLPEALPGVVVFGCTTAGQITPEGYEDAALVALVFQRRHFRVASHLFKPISPVSIANVVTQSARLAAHFPTTPGRKRLALVFADGLSMQEDVLMAALDVGLKDIPVFGGSAGDGLAFRQAFVLHDGAVHNDAALLLLLETELEFRGLGFDHFQPTDRRMVVTRAVPEERLVLEINGSPADREYARLAGVTVADLSPIIFAQNPVLVRNRDIFHVRAIQQRHDNGGLTFLSAIDEGLSLTLGGSEEIIKTLDAGLAVRDGQGAAPDVILGFDCYLRKLEIVHKGLGAEASACLRARRVVGFNTYGEQHLGVHVNQTFVGVAFFNPNPGPVL